MPIKDGKIVDLELPRKHARVLFDQSKQWRFRELHGGRNGAKDWSIAAAAIEIGIRKSTRFLFTREVQKTLAASAHQLLKDTIQRLGYSQYFEVLRNEIRCKQNETIFLFEGLNDIVASDLKSFEGIDIAVICEAEDLTKQSFQTFNFTIRKPGSQIWIQFNPQFEDDFVYSYFVTNPPGNCIGCQVNGFGLSADGKAVVPADNPWVSPEQIAEAQKLLNSDKDAFDNQCLGLPKGSGGRVFPLYNKDIHEIDFDLSYLPECDLYMSIDPHRKYYPAITWYAVTPTSATVVYNFWPRFEELGMWYDEARNVKTFDMDRKQLANIILANDHTFQGGKIISRVGDPRFLAENTDFVPGLMEHGVVGWLDIPFERIETQRENLKSLMSYNPAIPFGGCNLPDWYVVRDLTNKTRAYRRHSYDQEKDKESEVHKDPIDNDRYFLSQFPNGKPVYLGRHSVTRIQTIKSLASIQLANLPAQGYYNKPK
jgi:hypothetical protein